VTHDADAGISERLGARRWAHRRGRQVRDPARRREDDGIWLTDRRASLRSRAEYMLAIVDDEQASFGFRRVEHADPEIRFAFQGGHVPTHRGGRACDVDGGLKGGRTVTIRTASSVISIRRRIGSWPTHRVA